MALDPGGFWSRGERRFFGVTVSLSIQFIRLLQPVMPLLTGNPVTRTLLFAQFSARPWRIPALVALREMRSFASAESLDAAFEQLAHGPGQEGTPAGTATRPIVIGWGRQDRVCLPRQAQRALARFPDARLVWFDHCGHFPHWDAPEATAKLILDATR